MGSRRFDTNERGLHEIVVGIALIVLTAVFYAILTFVVRVRWDDGPWMLATTIYFAGVAFLYAWVLSFHENRRINRSCKGLCRRCGYDLRGSERGGSHITCPECGSVQASTYVLDDDAEI